MGERLSGFGPTAYPGPVYPVLPHTAGMDEHEAVALPEPCACMGGEGCDGSFCKRMDPPDPWSEPYTDESDEGNDDER